MKRLLAGLIVAVGLLPLLVVEAAPSAAPIVGATEAAVLDASTGQLLWGKNETKPVHPASLTKMITGLIAIEEGNLDDVVIVDVDGYNMGRSTVMGLRPGMAITLEDLLYGLMLPSGNDAALAIGRHISGDDRSFVQAMNLRVRWMGLTDTNFTNPHGLDNDLHFSTAADLAIIAQQAMANPTFARIAGATAKQIQMDGPATMFNLNRLLGRYPGADGIKVGYTRRSGPSLAASATRNGIRMIAIVLNSPDPPGDSARLLDWAFAQRRA